MRPLLLAFTTLALVSGCATSGPSGPTVDSAMLTTPLTFADYLRSEGLFLEGPEYVSTTTFLDAGALNGSITTYLVSTGVGGERNAISIYPFQDATTARSNVFAIAEARQTPGIGGGQEVPRDKFVYQEQRMVVVYYGRDSSVRSTLRAALGAAKRRAGTPARSRSNPSFG